LQAISVAVPADMPTMTIRVGVAADPWKTVVANTDFASVSSVLIGLAPGSVAFAPLAEKDGGVNATVTHDFPGVQSRLITIGIDGEEHPSSIMADLGSNFSQITATFPDLKIKDIKSINLQTRPYRWVEFKNVALNPKK
jgi:hypothetical protein